jgi:hypothetical protein
MKARLAAVVLAGCVAESGGGAGVSRIDTLPSGTVVVHNPAHGVWDSASTWRLVEDLRIGSAEGDEAVTFSRIAGLAVDAAGRIYVLDAQAQDVRVFAADGRHLRTIGRKGGGPGEFADADGIAVDDAGTLWVGDRRARRLSVFDTSGALEQEYRREGPGFLPRPIVGWSGTALWEAWDAPSFDASDRYTVLLRFADGAYRDTLRLAPFQPPQWRIVSRRGNTTSTFNFPVPFTARELIAPEPAGGVWRAVSGTYRLTRFVATGDSSLIVLREYEPVAVTATERDRALMRYRETFRESGTPLDESLVPAVHPALHGMWVDDHGFVWVMPAGVDTVNVPVDVFDRDGRYLGAARTTMTPRMLRPQPVVRNGHLYYVTTDTLDVPYVIRQRIEQPDQWQSD